MEVTVLLFASLAEKAGRRRVALPICEGDTVADVRDRLVASFPALTPYLTSLVYALDEEYVTPAAAVRPGATVALIPPVSGG